MDITKKPSLSMEPLDEILSSISKSATNEVIPILQQIQKAYGYLPREVIFELSRRINVPVSRLFGVATFYEQFYLEPHGKHTIKCCRGTACHVKGGQQVIDSICRALGVEEGGTTEDMEFTFETVACLGVCALAPVMMIDEVYFGKMTPEKVGSVLDSVRTSEKEKA